MAHNISAHPDWHFNNREKAYEFIDPVILNAPDFGKLDIADIIFKSTLSKDEKDIARYLKSEIERILVNELKFAEHIHPKLYSLQLTKEGRKAKKAGGYKLYGQQEGKNEISSDTYNTILENNGTVIQAGHGSSFDDVHINPDIKDINKSPSKKANDKSWMEYASWIAGILAVIITILTHFKIWPFN